MEKNFELNKKNPENCSCQCHFKSPLFYHIDCCCCPFLCYSHESCPNVICNSCKSTDSPRIIFPHKEQEFQIRSEQRNKKTKLFSNKIPFLRNKINNIFQSKTNTEEINNDIEKIQDNKTFKEGKKKESKDKKIKPLFKKIKVHKSNHERILTIPINYSSRHKSSIDINSYSPSSIKKNNKVMKFNDCEFDKNKKIFVNKNLNITNISPKNKKSSLRYEKKNKNKFILGDKNDDILNTNCTSAISDNRKILQNIKNEIDKTKDMINNLKSENKILKNKLNEKEKNNNSNIYNEIDILENNIIRENNEEKWERDVKLLKDEIKRITDKLKEYENFIDLLKKRNDEQEIIIEKKNKEILNLMIKIGNFDKSLNNNEQKIEKRNNSNIEFKNSNYNLKNEILKLKELNQNKDNTIKELEIKLKFEKNYNNKKQKMLEIFFNFYQNLKKVINYDISNESLQNIIDVITIDEFKNKINHVEKNIIKAIEDIQIKYGHCFACDIACCTSRVDKLKTFRKKPLKKK